MNWQNVKIGDLITQVRGVTYSSGDAIDVYKEGYVELLRANNIAEGHLTFDDVTYVPKSKVNEKQYLKQNDIVIAASSGSISVVGKAASFNANRLATFGAFCKVLRPNENVDARYIANYFQTSTYRRTVSALAEGANINNLRNEHIDNLDIFLPPLAEQKRIAEILDKAAEIKAKREQAIAKLDELMHSTFVEMFEQKLLQSDKTVGDFFEVNNNRYMTNLNDTDEVPFIPMSAVSENSKCVENAEIRKYFEVKKGYSPIKKGDLIVAKITPCYENGKQAVVNNIEPLFAYGSTEFHTFRNDDSGLIFVLHYYLQTLNVKRKGAGSMKGAAGQRRVPDSFFKDLPFALLPAESVEEFKSIIKKCNAVRSKFVCHVASTDKLIASLQQQAFATGFNA